MTPMRARAAERSTERSDGPRRLRVYIIVGIALVGGLVGRSLVADGAADNPLLNWLPWLNRTPITLYFGDASGDYLVPVSLTLSRDADAVDLVEALLSGPAEGTGLVNLVPAGTVVRSVSLGAEALSVDLSGEFFGAASPLAHEAVRQSLASWPEVEEVYVTVDGAPLGDATSSGHLVYFYNEDLDMLAARPTFGVGPRDVLGEYLEGPGDGQLIGLPPDVQVLSFDYNRSNGLLTLDFTYQPSVRALAVDHPQAMRRVLEGLLATLTTGFPDIAAVWLDFEGHEALGLGQCADLLRTAQTQPEILNDERLLSRYAGA